MTEEDESKLNTTCVRFVFHLPSCDLVELLLATQSASYFLTVRDLKWKLYETIGFNVNPCRVRLICDNNELQDQTKLVDLKILSTVHINVVVKVIGAEVNRQHFLYTSFVKSVEPSDGAINVDIRVMIVVSFVPNSAMHVLFIPALLNIDGDIKSPYSCDMVQNFKGDAALAAQHGHRCWTSTTAAVSARILLLEVDEGLDLRLETLRYNADGALNYEYDGGDSDSWQRYTSQPPVQCQLVGDFVKEGDAVSTVTMTPFLPLKCDTQYAVLLCNGTPTIPLALQEAGLYTFLPDGVADDQLYFFRTAATGHAHTAATDSIGATT